MLINSGCVIQKENGELMVLPHDEAEEMFQNFNLKHRKLYQFRRKKELKAKAVN